MSDSSSLYTNPPASPRIDYSRALTAVKYEQMRRHSGLVLPKPRTLTIDSWPPDYAAVWAWRTSQLARFELDPSLIDSARQYYRTHPADFINHWINTYDPRNAAKGTPVKFPLIMFERQEHLIEFCLGCLKAEAGGQVEKSRDMGATWIGVAFSVWLWLFGDSPAVGWGSQKQEKVDRLGDPSTVFEKIRMAIRALPPCFLPHGFNEANLTYMRCINPETGATIIGEIGDDIGRGGRTVIYFVDEAAHLDRPEAVEASLLETTRVRIDISSVSGLNTVFYRKREAGQDWEPGQPIIKGRSNVFVMDWRHHPTKTREWYEERKRELTNNGLAHVFAREIDRDYAAALEGVIIPADWIEAAIDAHKKLGFDDSGGWFGGLDVADGGLDSNALIKRKGVIVRHAETWGERDTGVSARRAVVACQATLPIELQYDCIGVGSGIKAEINRLREEGLLPRGFNLTPWDAGAGVLNPMSFVIEGDEESPHNRDFYQNLKAQAWWMTRYRFERTYRAVKEGVKYSPDLLVSLDSEAIPADTLLKLRKELSQATATKSTSRLKLMVVKTPEGTRSPNLADAFVMCFWPLLTARQRTVSTVGVILVRG